MIIFAVLVAVILLTIGIVWLIDKYLPKKSKPLILVGLWIIIIFLGYLTFIWRDLSEFSLCGV